MKSIICALGESPVAGSGPISPEECMECSLEHGGCAACGFDYSFLYGLFGNMQDRRDSIHVTDLTGCLLKSYWSKVDPSPQPVQSMIYAMIGTNTHGFLEDDSSPIFTAEVPLEALGIVGRADVFYEGLRRIVDYKTTRWLVPSKLPYGSHALQVNIYAAMIRERGGTVDSGAVQYIDMSGPTKCQKCRIPAVFDIERGFYCERCGKDFPDGHFGVVVREIEMMPQAQIVQIIKNRAGTLRDAIDGINPPPGEPSWLCNYCQEAGRCPYAQ